MPDVKATIQVDAEVWKQFRMACMDREVVAGRMIEAFMKRQLDRWQKETKKGN